MSISLRLPMPPSSNHRLILMARKGQKPRLVLAPEHRAWKAAAIPAIRAQLPADFAPFERTVILRLHLVVATLASDVSNRIKTLEDALQAAGVFENDRQVGDAGQFAPRFTRPGEEEFVEVYVGEGDPLVHAERNQRLLEAGRRAMKAGAKLKDPIAEVDPRLKRTLQALRVSANVRRPR